jgi:hypothetical protein
MVRVGVWCIRSLLPQRERSVEGKPIGLLAVTWLERGHVTASLFGGDEFMDFEQRKRANENIERKDNTMLYAGSPMFYYCRSCGAEMIEPELHPYPAPRFCDDCIREGHSDDPS